MARYVEIGHAERRRLFGEDESITAHKAAAVARTGLVPVVCVGEPEPTDPDDAARTCAAQLEPVLRAVSPNAELLFACEPLWAIGAAAPAPAEHVLGVGLSLRQRFADRPGRTRLIYGGSAGPGLFGRLADGVDGLFLGRFAHDIANLRAILAEMSQRD